MKSFSDYFQRNRLRILMYHSISDTARDRDAVTPAMFAAQMEYLAAHAFRVLGLADACRLLDVGGDLRRTVVLTFDDGYQDFLNALPILTTHRFPATLFVVSGFLGQTARWRSTDSARLLLTHTDLERVRTAGIALGSHSVTHPDLTALNTAALEDELCRSRAEMQALGENFFPFAYPGGSFTGRVRDAVAMVGYDCAVIVGGRWGSGGETDRFLLKREPMRFDDTLDWFAKRVNGFYELHYLGARARRVRTR